MLRFEQFWQVGQLPIRDWTCSSGGGLAHTETDGLGMCVCIDKYCDEPPVKAISYLEVA
jgi:hypothetical protein